MALRGCARDRLGPRGELLSALQSTGCHIDSTHTSFALHLAGAFGHRMVEKEYCLGSGTEVRLGVTEGTGEDRLTLTLNQAQRPLDHF